MTSILPNPRPPGPNRPTQARAQATRQALLRAALQCFAADHYDSVGVRDIAALAGVNAALINRYFQSKEALLAEVIHEYGERHSLVNILDGPLTALGERLSRQFLDPPDPEAREYYRAILQSFRSASSSPAALLAPRQALVEGLSTRLSGPDAHTRAELIRAVLYGGASMTLHGEELPDASQRERFIQGIVRTVQAHVNGTL